MVAAREIDELLDDRPDLEPALEAVLEPEAPWTFDDVDVDSGAFGELVSRDLVVEESDGYRVADRAAIRHALDGSYDDAAGERRPALDIPTFSMNGLELAAIAGVLTLVFALRLTSFPAVFQGDAVVLSSNDPYYYRYLIEKLLLDPETTLSSLPGTVSKGEPLMLAMLWLVTVLLGGTVAAAGTVLAWYPVVSALLTGILVYVTAVLVTDDRRIGLASVAMLAVLPGHAFRTSVGFADHHAFDYPWLALTILGAVLVTTWTRRTERRMPLVAGGVGSVAVGVAGQVLAWEAGPLLILPLGLVIAAMSITAVHRDDSVLLSVGPLVIGLALASALTWYAHQSFNWHTTLVASSPLLLTLGAAGILVVGEAWYRADLPAIGLVGAEAVTGLIGLFVLRDVRPEYWSEAMASVSDRLIARREIAEVQSLFSDSAGWLLLFGFLLLLALPYLVWASRRALDDDRWTPLAVYGWCFLVLAAIQIRFAGQLSLLVAVFAGLGFVHLADWIDAARQPAPFSGTNIDSLTLPDRQQLLTLAGLFVLVTSLSIVQVPIKTSQITIQDGSYETAAWMAEYSAEHDMEYPENRVFSEWGRNRMYNYFVNGESQSYGFARSNYVDFVTATNDTDWYDRLRGRVGFVVTTPKVVSNDSSLGTRLHAHDGSRNGSTPGLAHYRLVHAEDDGDFKAFTLVEGAVLTGQTDPNETVTVRTSVELQSYSFEYVRATTADENGTYSVRVAHPGTYEADGRSVTVPESAVRNSTNVRIESNRTTSTTALASPPTECSMPVAITNPAVPWSVSVPLSSSRGR